MQRIAGFLFMLTGLSSVAVAGTSTVPEIGPESAAAALAVMTGAVLIVRARRK